MKTITKTSIGILTVATLMLSSCKKEPIKGCMDSTADNYKSTAEESDGSCSYSAELNFYMSPEVGNALKSLGASTGKFYVNNEFIGSLSVTQTLSAQPYCGDKTNVVKKTLTSKSKITSFVFKTVDEDGATWIKGQTITGINLKSSGYCNTYKW